jgi:hypothetical protein
MTKLVNRAKMTTATTGTGTLTLGSAVDGYQTFADAGVANADVVRYVIEDGDAWEIGLGTYTASGTTLTRGSIESSNSDSALNLSGDAVVFVSAAAADLQELVDFADNFVLPTADGSTGQVLTTNGAGTLTFTTISGYSDADVDTHLNTGTASSGEVLSWTGSDYDWIAVTSGATDIDGLSDGYSDGSSVGLGSGALANDDGTSNNNTAVGINAGNRITSGPRNTGIGRQALEFCTTGTDNVAVGYQSLHATFDVRLTGQYNTAIGNYTGENLSTGAGNFLGGFEAGTDLTTGSNNVAIGNGALDAATTGGRNIAIGQDAMGLGVATNATGDNIAIGYRAGYDLTSGTDNVMIGEFAGTNITSGVFNVAIGTRALDLTTGSLNIAIGSDALGGGDSSANIAIGIKALETFNSSTSSYNIALGYEAATTLTSGVNNTILGYQAEPSSATVSNEITLGNSSITNLRVPGVGFQFDTTDGLIVPKTITAGGTTGAQTINKTAGSVNFAAAATSLVVTNSFVDADSVIIATVGTNDVTMTSVQAVAAAGSFTLYANAAATAETRVNWFVAN